MPDYDYDLITLGAGSGGVAASRRASALGAKVAIIEGSRVGGTCVIRGCVPKKLLVYGAHFAEDLADARRFGWDVPPATFNWPTLRDNVLAEVARLEGIYSQTLENNGVEIIKERARLTGPNSVELGGGRTVSAKTILIAVGDQDPVGGGGALVDQLAAHYRSAGLIDVTVRVFPGARHEILNETNRTQVRNELIAWMMRAVGP